MYNRYDKTRVPASDPLKEMLESPARKQVNSYNVPMCDAPDSPPERYPQEFVYARKDTMPRKEQVGKYSKGKK